MTLQTSTPPNLEELLPTSETIESVIAVAVSKPN
jgi:hypothetical protein